MFESLRRPSPATVIACIALFFAIAGGSAIALQGANGIDANDISRGAVRAHDLADEAVGTRAIRDLDVRARDIAAGAIGSGKIRDGRVLPADLSPVEAPHVVGATGEVPFSNGGEGDCLHFNDVVSGIGPGPISFYKDPYGRVYLNGYSRAVTMSGGDGNCDTAGPEGDEDRIVFILPEGYRPDTNEILFLQSGTVDIIREGGTGNYPAGAVIAPANGFASFEGISFRAATATP